MRTTEKRVLINILMWVGLLLLAVLVVAIGLFAIGYGLPGGSFFPLNPGIEGEAVEASNTPEPAVTATSTNLPTETAMPTATVTETPPVIDPAETLFNEGIEGYQSFLLLTEGKSRSFLGGDAALKEVKQGVAGMARQLINAGITKIAGPQLAQAELEALVSGSVEVAILDSEDEAVPEGYYSIQARGFETGGWGIFVEGPDGLLRVVLPRGETSLSLWVTLPTGAIDTYRLPGQTTWPGGRLEIVKTPGASWRAAIADGQGQVMALVDSAGEVDKPMTVWALNQKIPPPPTVTPTPEIPAEDLNYSFSLSIRPESLQSIVKFFSVQPYGSIDNLTEQKGYSVVTAYGYAIAYDMTSVNGEKSMYVLFATTGGVFKAKIDYILDPGQGIWPQPQFPVKELTLSLAAEFSGIIDISINKLDKNDLVGNAGYVFIIAVNNKAEAKNCQEDMAPLKNVRELCFYDPSLPAVTPQEMMDMIRSAIVSAKNRPSEDVLEFDNYPLLSVGGNAYIGLQIPNYSGRPPGD